MEASFLSRHSFAQRPNCFPLEFTPLAWILWSLTLSSTNSQHEVLLQSEESPLYLHTSSNSSSLCASGFVSLPHIHNIPFFPLPIRSPAILQRSPPSQPPPQGLPQLCQDPGSSPSLYSKLTIIFSVHLTCLKNQFLRELVNINICLLFSIAFFFYKHISKLK